MTSIFNISPQTQFSKGRKSEWGFHLFIVPGGDSRYRMESLWQPSPGFLWIIHCANNTQWRGQGWAAQPGLPTVFKASCPFSLLTWGWAQLLVQHCPLQATRLHYPRMMVLKTFQGVHQGFVLEITVQVLNFYRDSSLQLACLRMCLGSHPSQILPSCHCTKCKNLQVQAPKLKASFKYLNSAPLSK